MTGDQGAPRRPDASMDLLNAIFRGSLDPGYAEAAASGRPPRRHRIQLVAALAVVGLLLGLAGGQTMRTAPARGAERGELIERIRAEEARQDGLRARVTDLNAENARLEAAAAGLDEATLARIEDLAIGAGRQAVRGPGVRLLVDDGPDAGVKGSEVVDADLRIAVNALWAAGAEAIAINGHRLSSRTAIRGAGQAITVDYRSLTRPYTIEAIGDGRQLQREFAASGGGVWWNTLQERFGMRFEMTRVSRLELPADPGLDVNRARARR